MIIRSPSGRYSLLGRWVSTNAAAVFVSLLLLGLHNTLAAALTVSLRVIPVLEPRFRMPCPTQNLSNQLPLTDHPRWE
ncbi:hypothetical protein [Labrys neptuniae]|uniref:Secreted protein n=1 Tax=Labrys neptuniae TaxID=376174 RepID=A0ABV3PIL5_9HYPH